MKKTHGRATIATVRAAVTAFAQTAGASPSPHPVGWFRSRIFGVVVGLSLVAVALFVPGVGRAGGGPPQLAWSPTTGSGSYDYGAVHDYERASQTFTLTNSGGSGTSMLTVSLSGPAAFTPTQDGCTGASLGPGKSCSVTVRYAPMTSGVDSAALMASGGNNSASIALSGTGLTFTNWPMFRNSLDHQGWNDSERTVSLVMKWSLRTGGA